MRIWKYPEHGELESDEVSMGHNGPYCNICMNKGKVKYVKEMEK